MIPTFDAFKLGLLRAVIGSEHTPVLMAGSFTHDAGLRLTFDLVWAGCSDDLIEQIVRALLPPGYAGNTLDEVPEFIRSARRKVDEPSRPDQKKPPRPSASETATAIMQDPATVLFHDQGRRAYVSLQIGNIVRHMVIGSLEANLALAHKHFLSTGKGLSERATEEINTLLAARARFEGPMLPVFERVGGGDPGMTVIDLCGEDGSFVLIDASGWRIEADPKFKFARSPGSKALPLPVASGGLQPLTRLLKLEGDAWILVLAFLLLCLRPNGPYMLLLVEGQQGSGKSFLCSVIKRIIDPNQIEKARLPDNQRDLMIHAQDFYLLSFDNASGMRNDMSDALCTLATGGGFATRKLHTDNELFVFDFCRAVVINGIADFANRPDLLERAIPLSLPQMPDGTRRSESEMTAELERITPGVLGALYDIVAAAHRNLPRTPVPTNLRMADAAQWLAAAEPATGLAPGSFLRAIVAAQDEVVNERTQNDHVVSELQNLLDRGPFEGTVSELLQTIRPFDNRDRFFPSTPAHLSRHLARIKPGLEKIGIHVTDLRHTRTGTRLRVWREGEEKKSTQTALGPSARPPRKK